LSTLRDSNAEELSGNPRTLRAGKHRLPTKFDALGIRLRMACVMKNDGAGQFPFLADGNRRRLKSEN